jgi:ribosome-associated translation inhibitor RaiA
VLEGLAPPKRERPAKGAAAGAKGEAQAVHASQPVTPVIHQCRATLRGRRGKQAMQVPVQITFRHMRHSEAVEAEVRDKAAKVSAFFPRLTSCRVVIDEESMHRMHGRRVDVRVEFHMPGHELSITRGADVDPLVAVREAFAAAGRKLEEAGSR